MFVECPQGDAASLPGAVLTVFAPSLSPCIPALIPVHVCAFLSLWVTLPFKSISKQTNQILKKENEWDYYVAI